VLYKMEHAHFSIHVTGKSCLCNLDIRVKELDVIGAV
jgi:hypothetical protein